MYFKITNEEEIHHGFQYVDGLNILTEEFQEEGSCVQGGFYFTDIKNILKFLDYGIYLREVTLPTDDPDFKMVLDPQGDKWRANKIILGKRYLLSDLETFKFLVEQGADFRINNDYTIQWTSKNGYLEITNFLVEKGADFRAY